MGPVACVTQLAEAKSPAELGTAIAAVAAYLDEQQGAAKGSGRVDAEWCHAAAAAAASQLDQPGGGGGGAQGGSGGAHDASALLSIASRAFGALRAHAAAGGKLPAGANPDALQYSLIRKLVGRGAHAAALAQGWELYESLSATAAEDAAAGAAALPSRDNNGNARSAAKGQQQQQQQRDALLAGAVINLVVCTAEAGAPDPRALGALGGAVARLCGSLLAAQGAGGASAAASHADTLVRYSLKVNQKARGDRRAEAEVFV